MLPVLSVLFAENRNLVKWASWPPTTVKSLSVCLSAVRSTVSAGLRAVRRSIRSTAVYCGELYCVVESRNVNRLEMQSTSQICFHISGEKNWQIS